MKLAFKNLIQPDERIFFDIRNRDRVKIATKATGLKWTVPKQIGKEGVYESQEEKDRCDKLNEQQFAMYLTKQMIHKTKGQYTLDKERTFYLNNDMKKSD